MSKGSFGEMVSATYPGKTIGERVAAKNADIRTALNLGDSDPEIKAISDALKAVGITTDDGDVSMSGGRKHKSRGGVKSSRESKIPSDSYESVQETTTPAREEVEESVKEIKTELSDTKSPLSTAIAKAVSSAPNVMKTIGTSGAVLTALNRPTLFGNLAQLAAFITREGINSSITATWGDWGNAVLQIANALKTAGVSIAEQSAQGPVVPFAIATAIMMWRAGNEKMKLSDLIKKDAEGAYSATSRMLTSQIQAFNEAYEKEGKKMGPQQLGDIARRIKPTEGPGAKETSKAMVTGAPALQSMGTEATAVVPAFAPKPFSKALEPIVTGKRKRDEETTKPVEPNSDERALKKSKSLGGRRKKTRRTAKKQRVTRRKFVY